MAAYGVGDQVASSPPAGGAAGFGTWNLPNFVGELFKLSPLDTPLLSMIGGLTGGVSTASTAFTWQDTLHRAPALQAVPEGADASFDAQKRSERRNVVAIHQYGVELSYSKQSAVDQLGLPSGVAAAVAEPYAGASSILGNQPVQSEMDWQLQIKIEQAALDIELMFLTGTYAFPADGTARQSQGIVGAVSTDTTTTTSGNQVVDASVVDDLSKKLYDNGAPMRRCVLMTNSLGKVEIGDNYSSATNWNIQPRSRSVFGVNVTDLETAFGMYPVVLNRHLSQDIVLILDLDVMMPRFMPIRNKGHFFLEPLAKSGSYDREQLYGEIGLQYGPSGWHAKADNLHQV